MIPARWRLFICTSFAEIEDDFRAGELVIADLQWRAALERANELSRQYTPKLGARMLDILHIACAIQSRNKILLTYDERQADLARAAGLKIIQP